MLRSILATSFMISNFALAAQVEHLVETFDAQSGAKIEVSYDRITANARNITLSNAKVKITNSDSPVKIRFLVLERVQGQPAYIESKVFSSKDFNGLSCTSECEIAIGDIPARVEGNVYQGVFTIRSDSGHARAEIESSTNQSFFEIKGMKIGFGSWNGERDELLRLVGMQERQFQTKDFDQMSFFFEKYDTSSNKPYVSAESFQVIASTKVDWKPGMKLHVTVLNQNYYSYSTDINPEISVKEAEINCLASHEEYNFNKAVCRGTIPGSHSTVIYGRTVENFIRFTIDGKDLIDPIRQSPWFGIVN